MSGLVVLAVWVAILIGYTVIGLFGIGYTVIRLFGRGKG